MKHKITFGIQVFTILLTFFSVFIIYLERDKNASPKETEINEEMSISTPAFHSPFTYVMDEVFQGNIKY